MIRHYYKILDNDNNIISNSETRKVNDGFGNMHEFIGYDTKELAEFWAKDEMKLLSLDKNKHHIITIDLNILLPEPKYISSTKSVDLGTHRGKGRRSKKDILMTIYKDERDDI